MFSTEQIKNLNELEMQVYQYILQHKAAVPYMRIRELAAKSYVSPTTVLRFCKKMGCEGYSEFKWKMKNEAGQEKTEILPDNHEEICAFFDELKSGKYEAKLEKAASIANRLKKAGCAIISITNKEACTIAKLSDLNISYHISMCREGLHVDFSTQVLAVYLLEMLGKK